MNFMKLFVLIFDPTMYKSEKQLYYDVIHQSDRSFEITNIRGHFRRDRNETLIFENYPIFLFSCPANPFQHLQVFIKHIIIPIGYVHLEMKIKNTLKLPAVFIKKPCTIIKKSMKRIFHVLTVIQKPIYVSTESS